MNRILVTGLAQPEGPVSLAGGALALVEMDESRECLTRIDADGARVEICRPGGRPTGLALDGEGCFWVAGGPGNSLVRLSPEGRELLRIDGDGGRPFLFPNDLAFGPDGLLYMTDSGMRPGDLITGLVIRSDFLTAPYDGRVHAIDPREGRVVRTIATGLRFANGIAFGPDGALYFNETLTGVVYRREDGGAVERYADVLESPVRDRFKGPDGMAFATDGTLYCTVYGEGQVSEVAPGGALAQRIRTNGSLPTNIAFVGLTGEALVTEVEKGAVECLDLGRSGLDLHAPFID